MLPDPSGLIVHAIAILGRDGATDEQIEKEMFDLTRDTSLSRRLIDWIPEAFGFVLASHLANIHLPKTFSARCAEGGWAEIDIDREPIVRCASRHAIEIYHSDARSTTFSAVVARGSMFTVLNKTLNAGASLEGATLSGPALIGIPAETYR